MSSPEKPVLIKSTKKQDNTKTTKMTQDVEKSMPLLNKPRKRLTNPTMSLGLIMKTKVIRLTSTQDPNVMLLVIF